MGCGSSQVAPMGVLVDRESGALLAEPIHPTAAGRRRLLCLHRRCSCFAGTGTVRTLLQENTDRAAERADSPESKADISGFIRDYNVCVEEAERPPEEYDSLNDFFTRRLRPGLRPIAPDAPSGEAVAVQPADCRLHVFESVGAATEVYVKGKGFTLRGMIGASDPRAAAYEGGSISISRLAPADYHRFHSPVDAVVGACTLLPGALYTVKPLSVGTSLNVFGENKRESLELTSPQFGKVMMVIVGAVQVGKITRTVQEGQKVAKGDEIGMFSFGGSTVVTVFQKDRIIFDPDLVANSRAGRETYVRMGTSLGRACPYSAPSAPPAAA